ncbi:MAG: hypothetical protein LBQ66_10050, partial [Planctomycetaceae bacterium]|nr:hypothetical protein [Planctomycetaceae bacterium]
SKTDIPLIHYLKTNFGGKHPSLTTSRLTHVVLFKFWNKSITEIQKLFFNNLVALGIFLSPTYLRMSRRIWTKSHV